MKSMKKVIFCMAVFALTQTSTQAQDKKNTKTKAAPSATQDSKIILKNGIDSFSYAAGLSIADNMKSQGISDLNLPIMMKAFEDVLNNKPTTMTK